MTLGGADGRAAQRDKVSLPVQIGIECEGITRDLSATGLYAVAGCNPKVGNEVDLTIEFTLHKQELLMICRGTIVRVEHNQERTGLAVKFSETRLQVLEDAASGLFSVTAQDA